MIDTRGYYERGFFQGDANTTQSLFEQGDCGTDLPCSFPNEPQPEGVNLTVPWELTDTFDQMQV